MELDVGAQLELSFGNALKEHQDIFRHKIPKPVFLPLTGSNSAQGGGNGVILIGTPNTGKVWNVLTVTTVGTDDSTTVAGKVALYVDSDPANLGLGSCRIPGLAIPSFVSISNKTLWAHGNGSLCANVTGVAGGTQVVVNVTVAEWDESAISRGSTR